MKHIAQKNEGYSIIVAVLLIGFLLIMTTGTLNLVLQEMKDGRGRQNYLKAYAGAEGAMELGLLQIKQKGYGFYADVEDSEVLGTDKKDPKVSYTYDGRVQEYSGDLESGKTDIFPLFWTDEGSVSYKISDLTLSGAPSTLIWNIIGETGGISGTGDFHNATSVDEKIAKKIGVNTVFEVQTKTIESFLMHAGDKPYLIVYNPTGSNSTYTLKTSGTDTYFTTPREGLLSSSKIGEYSQNINTTIDNTEFLGILQYSIYSGN